MHTRYKDVSHQYLVFNGQKGEGSSVFEYFAFKVLPLSTYSAIAGALVGVVVSAFNFMLESAGELSVSAIAFMLEKPAFIPLYILAMLAILGLLYIILKKLPEARGSGVARTEAMLKSRRNLNYNKLIAGTVTGSFLSFLAGLSVGSEGPSMQLGAAIASKVEHSTGIRDTHRYIGMSGAAAGVATAFAAPITGIIFVLEELHERLNPTLLMTSIVGVIYAYLTRLMLQDVLHLHFEIFHFGTTVVMPLKLMFIPVIIGLVCFVASRLFNIILLRTDLLVRNSKIKMIYPLLVVFAVTIVANLLFGESSGSGILIIKDLAVNDIDPVKTLLLLVVKVVLITMVFRSSASGGIMVPMLSIGAMLGALIASIATSLGMSAEYVTDIVLVSMCVFFGTSISAPWTACFLFIETTGGFNSILPLLIAMFTALIFSKAVRAKSLYSVLEEREFDHKFLVWD